MKKQSLDSILTRQEVNQADKVRLVLSLSLPAILAQLTSIAMQYIDAGMVGSLGAGATASIGLVSSSTWLIGGSCIGISAGFYVQVAQLIGARRDREAEDVLRQGLITVLLIGALISMAGLAVSGSVPRWLGGEKEILANSTAYFRIYCIGARVSSGCRAQYAADLPCKDRAHSWSCSHASRCRTWRSRCSAWHSAFGSHYFACSALPDQYPEQENLPS